MTTLVGILNMTPDSFSDGDTYLSAAAALAHAERLRHEGAHIVDVGGESTRPGANPTPPDVEQDRILKVVGRIVDTGVAVSVDTIHASTAWAATSAGATYVNDVSGGLADPLMYSTVAHSEAKYILGHWRGNPRTMERYAIYQDPVGEILNELEQRIRDAENGGIDPNQIIIDPGLGFAKNSQHNWSVLSQISRFTRTGYPVMIGASRKRFLAELLDNDAPKHDRDLPTAIVTTLAVQAGVWAVRVHDVASSRIAVNTLASWSRGQSSAPALSGRVSGLLSQARTIP